MGNFNSSKRPKQPGKIEAPLKAKLEKVEWGKYKLEDLFEINSSKKIFHANKISKIYDRKVKNSFPYIVRTTQNNGLRGYISENEKTLNDENTLSFAQDTFSVFYQKQRYFTGNKVKILKPKFKNIDEKIMQYITASFQKSLYSFTWGVGSTIETIAKTEISLPTKDGKIDFDFMEEFVEELEKAKILKLDEYLEENNLKDCELTSEEKKVLSDFENGDIEWGEYRIEDVLNWQKQKEIDPLKLGDLEDKEENIYPFYGQSTTNNGVISYNQLTNKVLNNKNGNPTILIHSNNQNIVYLKTPFYLKDGHGATSVLQSEKLNKLNQMFFISSIERVIKEKYSYNNKATKIELKNTIISLPTKNNKPDYETMEILVGAVQKLVVENVVEYVEGKI